MRNVLITVVILLVAGPAAARDTWSTPHVGVRLLERTTDRPWRIFALKVDLCADGVTLRATARADKRRTVSSFADRVGAEAAVNGDFFSFETYDPTGLAISGGTRWHADMGGSGEILFGEDRAWLESPTNRVAAGAWAREAVGGRPLLVEGGDVAAAFNRPDCADRHPRTAVGLSQDRRTLVLAVVDGRSGSSVGMNCRELAGLMRELGSWRAMNLDGGGSSTLWVRGQGVVNSPSEGAQRVVANHLAVLAAGRGPPGSCDFSEAEPVDGAAAYEGGSTDVNGDGRADACARGSAGLDCHLAGDAAFGARWRIPDLANAACAGPQCWATIRSGDVNGDGFADVCARRAAGVRCWPGGAAGFGAAIDGPALSDASGWNRAQYYSTLRLADVTGDGRDDLCARAAAGVRCWPAVDGGFGAGIVGPALSDAAGWDLPSRYGTLRFGDLDADGRADLCARSGAGVRCWRSTGDGFSAAIAGPEWSDANGFDDVGYWSTFRLGDVDGDGRADACVRTAADLRCALSDGGGFAAPVAGPALGDDSGWADHDNYGTLRLGDVDGDGTQDACLRADARVYCWLSAAGAPFSRRIEGPELSDASGWGNYRYNNSIRLADVNGDGRDDVCARAAAGLRCWASTGDAFAASIAGPAWADANGWDDPQYHATLRVGSARCVARVEACNGGDDDCDGVADEGCAAPVPDPGVVPVPPDAGVAVTPDAAARDAAVISTGPDARPPDVPGFGFDATSPDGGPVRVTDGALPPHSDAGGDATQPAGAVAYDSGCGATAFGAPWWASLLILRRRRR